MQKVKHVFLLLFLLITILRSNAQIRRPFMIITEDMYPDMVKKSKQNSGIFLNFKNRAKSGWRDGNLNYCLIMYITETSNKKQYVNKIYEKLVALDQQFSFGGRHQYVGNANRFFLSLIAMDIIYNELNQKQIDKVERIFEKAGKYFETTSSNWPLSHFGINTAYAVYRNDAAKIKYWKQKYDAYLFDKSMMQDGSWGQSSGYVFFRMLHSRISKSHIIDVLQFTGHGDYYNDPRMQQLYEWAMGFALTPFGAQTVFGDTGHTAPYLRHMPKLSFAHKYGTKVKNLVDWQQKGYGPNSFDGTSFFIYALRPLAYSNSPQIPLSILKPQSGAALWGQAGEREAVQGILHSLKGNRSDYHPFGHSHQEANSFSIAGFGQHLIMNSGANYQNGFPGNTPDGKSLNSAIFKNSVLIGTQQKHQTNHGNGLIDGIVGEKIEFATTDAGTAISDAKHWRTMHLVKSVSGKSNPYFVIHDVVKPKNPNAVVKINFQVNSKYRSTETIQKNIRYQSPINGYVINGTSDGTEKVNLFFASKPQVEIIKSYKGTFTLNPKLLESDNIQSRYTTARDGHVRATTLIFPEDSSHAIPKVTNSYHTNYSGIQISHTRDWVDYYYGANPSITNTLQNGVKFRGNTIFFRKNKKKHIAYAASHALQFLDTPPNNIFGFSALNPISIVMEGKKGQVHLQKDTCIKFHYKNISGVVVDGSGQRLSGIGTNYIEVYLEKGRHHIQLQTRQNAPVGSPKISFINPTQKFFSAGDRIAPEVVAKDADGSIQEVNLFFNNNFVRKEMHVPYTWNGPGQNDPIFDNLPTGRHTIQAIAKDNSGKVAEAKMEIVVGSKPKISFRLPQKTLFAEGEDLSVEALASDSDGSIQSVALYWDNRYIRTEYGFPYSWNNSGQDAALNKLQLGMHALRAVVTDNLGLKAESTKKIYVGTPPNISFAAPTKHTFLVGNNLTVRANGSDADGLIQTIRLFFDGKPVKSSYSNPREWWGKYDPLMRNLQKGKHTLELVATDNSGIVTRLKKYIYVGIPAPKITFTAPTKTEFYEGENLTVRVEASNHNSNIKKISLFFDGQFVNKSPESGTHIWWHKYDPLMRNLKVGTHILKTIVYSSEGIIADKSMKITVRMRPSQNLTANTIRDQAIQIYPNPLQNGEGCSILFSQKSTVKIQVYDIEGKEIYSKTAKNTNHEKLHVNVKKKGVFLVKIQDSFQTVVRKLIIE